MRDVVLRTPLVRLEAPEAGAEIWLKLECLQPIGSFKLRGAANAIRRAPAEALAGGVVTASAGNMAHGVAWVARELGVPATIVVPEHAPQAKLNAIGRLGGRIVKVSYERWWQAMQESRFDDAEGLFVHPVLDPLVMAGNGTIGLELVEELDAIDAVVVPWGGGGLTTGIASALRAVAPRTEIVAVEPATGAPLAASLPASGSERATAPRNWPRAIKGRYFARFSSSSPPRPLPRAIMLATLIQARANSSATMMYSNAPSSSPPYRSGIRIPK